LKVDRIVTVVKEQGKRQFAEVLVSVIGENGKEKMVCALLDTGCSKSIILKKFTEEKRCKKLSAEERTVFLTYGSRFETKSTAHVAFRFIEFENNNTVRVEHEFEVDETHSPKSMKYDMIIGSDLMWNMGMDILFSEERVKWLDEHIPLKKVNTLREYEVCEVLYSIHTDDPLIKEMEDRADRLLDANYSKVDIPAMVDELDLAAGPKEQLKQTLMKFPELFGGGLGRLKKHETSPDNSQERKQIPSRSLL